MYPHQLLSSQTLKKKKNVGLVQTNFQSNENEYFRANFFIRKALDLKHEVKSLPIEQLLHQNQSLIISDDFDTTFYSNQEKILKWVGDGGTFLKFTGNKFLTYANNKDINSFLGVIPITKNIISLDGELSFEKDLSIKEINNRGVLKGLKIPKNLKVKKYLEIPQKNDDQLNSWVILNNGAPIITHKNYKDGNIILVHLPANNEWSNLSLSIFFPDFLRKVIEMSRGVDVKQVKEVLKPYKILNGFGDFTEPGIETLNLEQNSLQNIQLSAKNPPGIYKNELGYHGSNISKFIKNEYEFVKLPEEIIINNFTKIEGFKFINFLIALSLIIFIFESLINFLSRDLLKFKSLSLYKFLILVSLTNYPVAMSANEKINYVEKTKLAYAKVGIDEIDSISKNGLTQISKHISSKTSAIIGNPIGLDLEINEIDYFPILYIPLVNETKNFSLKAIKKLQSFINTGGILMIDCKATYKSMFVEDCLLLFNEQFNGLDISNFSKLTSESTLSKSFYLLNKYPGRKEEIVYVAFNNQINNDKVFSIIVGNNDWSGSWAKDSQNNYLLPLFSNDKEQRVLSMRFGINVVLYSLTGNYKSDQVHVPEILKRMKK